MAKISPNIFYQIIMDFFSESNLYTSEWKVLNNQERYEKIEEIRGYVKELSNKRRARYILLIMEDFSLKEGSLQDAIHTLQYILSVDDDRTTIEILQELR